ncbi:hypothetical protein ANO14919_060210 [Xylariales sp. No.14919]|nr:hypothetical protein ANO14919_060210 [Xylariales sp. No.14919]
MDRSQELERINADAGVVVAPAQKQPKKRVITAARKEQNKLSQRAYRKRQREQKRAQTQPVASGPRRLEPRQDNIETLCSSGSPSSSERDTRSENLRPTIPFRSLSTHAGNHIGSSPHSRSASAVGVQVATSQSSSSAMSRSESTIAILARMTTTVSDEPGLHPPGLIDMALGIRGSLEDNSTAVFRACMLNAMCIGIDIAELLYCERPCMSPFYRPRAQMSEDPAALVAASSHDSLPIALKPTLAQILIPHHASLDLIPLPRLRERAILMCTALPRVFSLWEMKLDIYTRNALVCHDHDSSGGSVSQPWDMRSWQAAPWFLSKWKMVVDTDEVKTNLSVPGIPGFWM